MSKTMVLAIGRLGVVVVGILAIATVGCFLAAIWLESGKFFTTGVLFAGMAVALALLTAFWYEDALPIAVDTKEKGDL